MALTDSTGGLEVARGFHKDFDRYFHRDPQQPPSLSGRSKLFTPLCGKKHAEVHGRMLHVPYEAGDAVVWDMRLPHATAAEHPGPDSREVVYTSFLPDLQPNREYMRQQLASLRDGSFPPDQQ